MSTVAWTVPSRADPTAPVATLLAAGDIAECDSDGDEQTAALVADMPGTVATLGDNAYEDGSAQDYARCYAPSWGSFRARTRPAAGNHEYETGDAAGYFTYFGRRAGSPTAGYYSYRLGTWHIIVLNSNCDEIGGCERGSPQERWLRAELARNPARCTLAYWHHPRFSSSRHGDQAFVGAFWDDLYGSGADVVLSGHDHIYERFGPQRPDGTRDPARGIVEFVVGTGGKSHYPILRRSPNSVVANGDTFGVLRLALRRGSYSFRFIPVAGKSFRDAGSAKCH